MSVQTKPRKTYQKESTCIGAIMFYDGKYHLASDNDEPRFERTIEAVKEAFRGRIEIIGVYEDINQRVLDFLDQVVAEGNSGKKDGLASLLHNNSHK